MAGVSPQARVQCGRWDQKERNMWLLWLRMVLEVRSFKSDVFCFCWYLEVAADERPVGEPGHERKRRDAKFG